jgi:signal transduction histidine kinase
LRIIPSPRGTVGMNQGVSIPAEMQDSIFDPFVSTDAVSSSALTRTRLGLGLFIVREIL